MRSQVSTTELSDALQIQVDLGWSACHVIPPTETPDGVPPTPSGQESGTGTRSRKIQSLLLPKSGSPHWCAFCAGQSETFQACDATLHAHSASVTHTDWQPCIGSCGWYVSTRVQFCVTRLERFTPVRQGLGVLLHSNTTQTPGANDENMPGMFPVLNSAAECAHAGEWLQELQVRTCPLESELSLHCNGPSWMWVATAECTAKCNGGVQEWKLVCQESAGKWVDEKLCTSVPPVQPPPSICNTAPCRYTLWVAGDWGLCSSSTSERTRYLTCSSITSGGSPQTVADANCQGLSLPVSMEPCKKAVFVCVTGACHRGTCTHGDTACTCNKGWIGSRCEDFEGCRGLVSQSGMCCPGVRSVSGECCLVGEELDAKGQCCTTADLDACRLCGGRSKVVDLVGACGTGRIDASGRHCDGLLDECGVCNGSGLSCALQATLHIALVATGPINSNNSTALMEKNISRLAVMQLMASIIPVPASALSISIIEGPPVFSLHNKTLVSTRVVTTDVTVLPMALTPDVRTYAQVYWLHKVLAAAMLTSSAMLDDTGSMAYGGTPVTLHGVEALLADVTAVGRRSVCGNGVCEVGEIAPIFANGTFGKPCLSDCPLTILPCPRNAQGDFCSGVLLLLPSGCWLECLHVAFKLSLTHGACLIHTSYCA
jgi:hypothetical protein